MILDIYGWFDNNPIANDTIDQTNLIRIDFDIILEN